MTRRILYVEDDRATRDAVLQVLTLEGYEVEGVEDGIEAIRRIYRNPPHLILLDLMLPKMNGYQVCRLIKTDPDLMDLPVLALTARSSEEDKVRGILTGADEYIVKPFDIADLLTRIKTWFSRMEFPEDRQVTDPFSGKSEDEILFMILSRVNHQLDERLFEVDKLRKEQGELLKNLSASERKYRELVESANDIVYVLDRQGRFTLINPMIEKLGYDRDDLIGRPFSDILANGADVNLGEYSSGTFSAQFKDRRGTPREMVINASAIQDGDDVNVGTLGIARDETDMMALEEQLLQMEKLAATGEMAAEIGHELNNYLTTISGHAELSASYLARGRYKDAREIAGIVVDRVSKLSQFAQDLLNPAKREHHPQVCDLNDLIRRLVDFIRRHYKFRSISFELDLAEEVPRIWADPTRMEQVLLNLYSNAANAMGSGTVAANTRWDQDAQEIVVSVENMGPGLSEEAKERIFRGRFTTRREGYGFGLWVCRRIVQHHEGEMGVESPLDRESGRGVRFWIRLPASSETFC